MASDSDRQLRLLIVDKLLLALVLALAGFFLNSQLQHTRTTTEYQRALFDARRDAYDVLLNKARNARDIAAELYTVSDTTVDTTVTDATKELAWRIRRRAALGRVDLVEDPVRMRGSPSFPQGPLFAALDSLETRRQDAALYISSEVDSAVDKFMEALWTDLSQYRAGSETFGSISVYRPIARKGAAQRAFEAFAGLRESIRRSLRIEEIILG